MDERYKLLEQLKAECFDWERVYEIADEEITEHINLQRIAASEVNYLKATIAVIEREIGFTIKSQTARDNAAQNHEIRFQKLENNNALQKYIQKRERENGWSFWVPAFLF